MLTHRAAQGFGFFLTAENPAAVVAAYDPFGQPKYPSRHKVQRWQFTIRAIFVCSILIQNALSGRDAQRGAIRPKMGVISRFSPEMRQKHADRSLFY
jgi:hypothetical protein